MSHYANQPGRSPGAAGWLASIPTLARVATLQTNGTKELPGVGPGPHAKFWNCAKCYTMLTSPIAN